MSKRLNNGDEEATLNSSNDALNDNGLPLRDYPNHPIHYLSADLKARDEYCACDCGEICAICRCQLLMDFKQYLTHSRAGLASPSRIMHAHDVLKKIIDDNKSYRAVSTRGLVENTAEQFRAFNGSKENLKKQLATNIFSQLTRDQKNFLLGRLSAFQDVLCFNGVDSEE